MFKDGAEVGWVPGGAFTTGFDRSLVLGGANEIDGEVSNDGHVGGAVAFAQAGEVLVEGYVERPMQIVFDRPMATHRGGEIGCRERARGDVGALRGHDPALVFDLGVDHRDGGDLGEAKGAGIGALGCEPVDLLGNAAGPDFEPSVALVDVLAGVDFGGGRRLEIAFDLLVERGLDS